MTVRRKGLILVREKGIILVRSFGLKESVHVGAKSSEIEKLGFRAPAFQKPGRTGATRPLLAAERSKQGLAKAQFDGRAWSEEHPDDCNHYLNFNGGDRVARVLHAQDSVEGDEARWIFGLREGCDVPGWFPEIYVDFER
ncbi:unnamed protein product [Effrenium voratum]|uniref:Uncharacterized protein n=1 Tax=Effrenium voratum TaxID=2562239 RepID=A0AA36MU39_9DINO|nr:unnamed protein product [Effrenium voratum]